MGDVEDNHDEAKRPEPSPPGEFVTEDLRAQTARFLEELKRRLSRERNDEEPRLGPPRRRK